MHRPSTPFAFAGPLPPSKSLLIRALLLQLYEPAIQIPVLSACADVVAMQGACRAFAGASRGRTTIDCGEAGLVLRLCLAYAARRGGDFDLCGTPRLLARPHHVLLRALRLLGTQIDPAASIDPGRALRVTSRGWHDPAQPIPLSDGESSQFASALLLNAWDLPFPLRIDIGPTPVSEGYLDLSIDLARRHGMDVVVQDGGLLSIPAHQTPKPGVAPHEADVSSAFAVAALAAVAGHCRIDNFPLASLQPDAAFVDVLRRMGVPADLDARGLTVHHTPNLQPVDVDVSGCPDLVPVLAVLCALAPGVSRLHGAPHLRGKESDRIATTAGLLRILGRPTQELPDGLLVAGRPLSGADSSAPRPFDAGSDHRLVMAAAVALHAGFALDIAGTHAVHKSFPEFLAIAGLPLSQPPSAP